MRTCGILDKWVYVSVDRRRNQKVLLNRFYQQFSIYLWYIMTFGDTQNLIAQFTIVREMCPDPSVKCKNLIFGYFQELIWGTESGFLKKWQKVDPHYFSILEGVYFLPFFQKTTLEGLKTAFFGSPKLSDAKFDLRDLECFLIKW